MSELMKCRNCSQKLKANMELEYSEELTSYFCKPDCAMDYYFNYMRSTPFIVSEKTVGELQEKRIEVRDGMLYRKEW